jgi:dTDP-4-amino-4,6-dideoxygalactose transaminase
MKKRLWQAGIRIYKYIEITQIESDIFPIIIQFVIPNARRHMKVPLLDLKKQYEKIKDEIIMATQEVFESQHFILGPKVEELEERIAEYSGCRYAVGVSSGTDALLISLMTAGVSPGDMVITTPYTFFATVGAIARLGAVPVFVDIDKRTYNMDPAKLAELLLSMTKEQRSRLKAIIPVHLYGQCADMEMILKIAREHNLIVIEDAAQAIGAEYKFTDGSIKRAGSMGDYGCFSFYPTKNLGAFGEGGMVTINDGDIYKKLKVLRNHGDVGRYKHDYIGGNFRLDALQAAILLVKLRYLDGWVKRRIKNADIYRELFKDSVISGISLPFQKEKRHIYNQFVIKVKNRRDELKMYLTDNGIGCEIYYPMPLHIQNCFKGLISYKKEDFPVSMKSALTSLALPIYPELSKVQLRYVVDIIKKFERIK